MRSRVLLVEDCAPMRDAVSRILSVECDLLESVNDGRNVVAAAMKHRPDVIVLDISLPGMSGMDLLPLLRASLPGTAIVMLTNHASEDYIQEAFRRGADGYVLKNEAHQELLPAVKRARGNPAIARSYSSSSSAGRPSV